ncbi:AAA family ATPase [Virgibacillus siamensis]|uniref:AAA family ATPase n=1 Tax=Virgibacillus siamensis TaxID=480071 RepID=UPI00098506ED|nr:AAA family ATPase [Virgibacillus siamensis]
MKFVLLFGPQAVGKMTVGQELAKMTGLKLLHNHMTIELLEPFFGFTPEMWRLSTMFRMEIIKSVAKNDGEGMIFTFVWAFNRQEDWDSVKKMCNIFSDAGAEICLVELEADVEERLKRNNSSNRLQHKPTKRNVAFSEKELLRSMKTERLHSLEGEITCGNYVRLNNTNLSAAETARIIKTEFGL